jgi:serine/threonine protein kinase
MLVPDLQAVLGKGAYTTVVLGRLFSKEDPHHPTLVAVPLSRQLGKVGELVAQHELLQRLHEHGEGHRPHGADECHIVTSTRVGELTYMPLMKGDGTKLSRAGKTLPQQLTVLEDTARGLARIHDQGFVHGDVKPDNFLYTSGGDGTVAGYVGDLGSVVAAGKRTPGTPAFNAPERRGPFPEATVESDLYAFGKAMKVFFFLADHPDVDEKSPAFLNELPDYEPPELVRPLVNQLMSEDPKLRGESMRTIADQLHMLAEQGKQEEHSRSRRLFGRKK